MDKQTVWIINNKTSRKVYIALANKKTPMLEMAISFNQKKLKDTYPSRHHNDIEPSKAVQIEVVNTKIDVEFLPEQNESINVIYKKGVDFELVDIMEPNPPLVN